MPVTVKKNLCVNGHIFSLVMGERWYLEYYIGEERKRLYGGLNRIKNLADRESAFIELANNTCFNPVNENVLTLAHENSRPLLRLKTYQSQKTRLKFFLQWLGYRSPELSINEAAKFIMHLSNLGKAAATIGSYRHTLSAIYQRAGLINPWCGVAVPSADSRSLMYFTPDQSKRLLAALKKYDLQIALAAQLLYYCFIRPGEMRLLTMDCINFAENTITIPAKISKNKRVGTVVIPEYFLKDLQSHCKGNIPGKYFLFGKYGIPGLLPVGKNHFNRHHTKVLAECKIVGRYAFYSWKHTGAVNVVKAGINLKDLQLQLRHHSLDMVNEYLKNLGVMDSSDLRFRYPTI